MSSVLPAALHPSGSKIDALLTAFIERRSALSLAGAAFRRPLRLLPSVTLALAIASIVAAAKGFSNAAQFSQDTQNSFAAPPTVWSSTIQYFNALVGLFFSRDAIDRGVLFFPPRGILWFVSA